MVDKVGAEELKLGCWKMAELRSGAGARVWWEVELEGEEGVAGRSFDVLKVFERGEDDSKDNGGNRGADVSVVPFNDE